MDPHRIQRVAEAMREELDEIINYELSDPRITDVAVMDVHLAANSHMAHITVQLPADAEAGRAALEALRGASGFIRRQLAERIDLFRVPELRFEVGVAMDPVRLRRILRRVRKGRPRDETDASQ
jgi:ribosome-binding factor A